MDWDTTAKTSSFTAVSGTGYFVNTTSGAVTVTLPAGSAGDIVSLADYANTWQTNAVTVAPNGADKIGGINANANLATKGQSVTFVYVDGTEGWKNVQDSTSNVIGNEFMVATGGCITTSGDYKIHSFTGPGTFTVSQLHSCSANNVMDYLVVGGGGSGSSSALGGGGAGGFRMAPAAITATVTAYPITVGAGGAARGVPGGNAQNKGSNSVFSTITSAGGGAGGNSPPSQSPDLSAGGSGGGIGRDAYLAGRTSANNGNSPPVSPPQGNPGGVYAYSSPGTDSGSSGGGGANSAGSPGSPGNSGGNGGAGLPAAPVFGGAPQPFYIPNGTANGVSACGTFAGGGGGGAYPNSPGNGGPGGAGGAGGGGNGGGGSTSNDQNHGTANTGGGGGGNYGSPGGTLGSNGGSGIVLIRYKFQ